MSLARAATVLMLSLLAACSVNPRGWLDDHLPRNLAAELSQLDTQNDLAFGIVLDISPCRLDEVTFWKGWFLQADSLGIDFVFLTCSSDSTDIAEAVRLEQIDPRVRCLSSLQRGAPLCAAYPLHLLYDRSGRIRHVWFPVYDSTAANQLTTQLDSIVTSLRTGRTL